MKYIVRESQIDKMVKMVMDGRSHNWTVYDEGDGEFNVYDGKKDVIKYRIRYNDQVGFFYFDPKLVWDLDVLFGFDRQGSAKPLIKWLNQKYDLNVDQEQWEYIMPEYGDDYVEDED